MNNRQTPLSDLRIVAHQPLLSPRQLKAQYPVSDAARRFVAERRQQIAAILAGTDPRMLAIVGPCSIHDIAAARDYAQRLKRLADRLEDQLLIVMRVYFEKPRTTIGWKGLINDPDRDDSFQIEKGLRLARGFLLELAEMGLAAATEMLDPIVPQYIGDLISWAAIGARTSESQTHREMASGLSMPVGFKNGTDGDVDKTINALAAASVAHRFLGIDGDGRVAIMHTRGNPHTHLILRGGRSPNYQPQDIARYQAALKARDLATNILVDCSHGNSGKDHRRQRQVLDSVLQQRLAGNRQLLGFMLESFIHEGAQAATGQLVYGQSITDACIGWDETERLLSLCAQALSDQQSSQLQAVQP